MVVAAAAAAGGFGGYMLRPARRIEPSKVDRLPEATRDLWRIN